MKTLKRAGALILASVMLFSLAGCKKKKGHAGAKSEEELVTKVIDAINGDIEYSEVEEWMDWYGWLAYRLMERTGMECDFDTAYSVVEDMDEDVDYIKKNHKEFVEAWEEENDDKFTKNSLRPFREYKAEIDKYLEKGGDAILEQFRMFAPYDNEFDEDNLHVLEDYDIGHYSIKIDDEEYHALEIQYYKRDGKFVCYGVNFVC